MPTFTLDELARRFGLQARGDAATAVHGVCSLSPGKPGCIGFLSNPRLRDELATSLAAIVIVTPRHADAARGAALIAADPYLAYARIARLFDPERDFVPGVHAGAFVADSAQIGAGCRVAAGAVIDADARVGTDVYIGPGCTIGRGAVIGDGVRLIARVSVAARVVIGARCQVQAGAVLGSRGFGNARGPGGWEEVPQLGSLIIGDDVEIGANTCIDRGAIDDTVIANGVRLDNLIQIAHNVRIGEHTAIAACTGIAGSTRIGRRCMIGGAVGIAGHVEIADDVILLGRAMVTGSIPKAGVYGSGLPLDDAREWRKTVARVRRLGRLEARLQRLEKHLSLNAGSQDDDHSESI
ncbi:UDP-3-O-(3-hydroxymyristoyl)glucosamine N-acyltransferase [Solimonas terrae]|uniref:UDP-3-O-acylglucosamine N-acyltransferase n=1 Tax=Solimonas terrae TaxID=1396819 RepID=A0A6M2BN15_9GAMM|nr:UDP-3-O-(3-hydroxymyristoyl)glucosamine N-acyltransferase [Solimonas terrae]NGY03555.1 UDP-3-O-(3-hydroxymyristoyl)glucosamine N-acyltransferase [Solimonas terrae]